MGGLNLIGRVGTKSLCVDRLYLTHLIIQVVSNRMQKTVVVACSHAVWVRLS